MKKKNKEYHNIIKLFDMFMNENLNSYEDITTDLFIEWLDNYIDELQD